MWWNECFSLQLAIGKYQFSIFFWYKVGYNYKRSHNMVFLLKDATFNSTRQFPRLTCSTSWPTVHICNRYSEWRNTKWNLLLYTSSSIFTCCIHIQCCTISAQLALPWWYDASGNQMINIFVEITCSHVCIPRTQIWSTIKHYLPTRVVIYRPFSRS